MMNLFATVAFSGEIKLPGYEYVYEITGEKDVEIVLDIIKTWISLYKNYNCTIKNAEQGNEKLAILAIRKLPANMMIGTKNEAVHCQFYLNDKKIEIFLSKYEIIGLTESYEPDEREKVFDKIYNLYLYNMKAVIP
jgi:hypothetical protein